jgi:hypothetical protein
LLKKADLKMGYRFELSEARWRSPMTPGGRLTVSTLWKNTGIGRLPFRHYPAFYLLDQKGGTIARCLDRANDPTQWFSGDLHPVKVEIAIPRDVPAGSYALAAGMEDPQGVPRIALGIQGDDGRRRFILGQVILKHSLFGWPPWR